MSKRNTLEHVSVNANHINGYRWTSVHVMRANRDIKYYYQISRASYLRLLRALGGW